MTERKRPPRPGEGRPTLYKPEYCELVLEDMAKGYSLTAFAGLIGVCRDTLHEWMTQYPEFSEAVRQGKSLTLRKWEADAHRIAKEGGGNGSATIVMFGMKNMGGHEWGEKQDQQEKAVNELVIRVEGGLPKEE